MEDVRFEELKSELFNYGYEAVKDFLGYEIDWGAEDKDSIDQRIDEVYEQMPEDVLEAFYKDYKIGPVRELGGKMCVCYEAGKPGMMRLALEGCFGPEPENNRSTLMLIPMDMASEDIDMLSDMWLTEQEKEMGLPIGEFCSSSSWWAGSKDDSHDGEITDKYDWLVERCYQSEKLADGLLRMEFSSEGAVRNWLEMNESECDSFEEFEEWLQQFFDDGNSVVVEKANGRERYDFDDCMDLFYGNSKMCVGDLIAAAESQREPAKQGKVDRDLVERD